MRLKRLYNHDAPEKEWWVREQVCLTCRGKGVVVNDAGDGLADCPNGYCDNGTEKKTVPPVSGVEVLHYNSEAQNFPIRTVDRGQREGWLELNGTRLVIRGENKTLTYQIVRTPGNYDDGTIHYYECELVEEA